MTNFQSYPQKYLTPEGRRKAEEELEHLKTKKRLEIAKKIEQAKELGDLSENAEYADAKDEQAFAEARIIELTNLLKYAETVSGDAAKGGVVTLGSVVTVEGANGRRTYTIVGYNESNPSLGKISNESPLGQALLGHQVGDKVSARLPNGAIELIVISIK